MASKRPPDDSADPNLLFDDDPPKRPAAPQRKAPIAPSDGYELEGGDIDDEPAPAPRAGFVPAESRPKARSKPKAESTEEARVDEVWSRGGEWGGTLMVVGGIAAGFLVMTYILLSNDQWINAFGCLLIGMVACLAFSYPIFITLERPVRITPEQAARDYYAALSHALPHYKRMWLLLSTPGRESTDFSSFAEFRAYWKRRLAEVRSAGGRSGTLSFEVVDFKSEKSAGKTFVDGKYTVAVKAGGDASAKPVETIRVDATFAKGPDNMWYLNTGTLPGRV